MELYYTLEAIMTKSYQKLCFLVFYGGRISPYI